MPKDKSGIKGHIKLRLFDKDGNLKQEHEHSNIITVGMDEHVANALSDDDNAGIGWMAVGETNGGKSTASTALEALIAGSNNALDSTAQGTTTDDNDVIYVCSWAAGDGTGTIIEAGLFNVSACTSGMMAYDESMSIVKGAADTLEITWTVTFGAS
jgi:hypothetical protein